MNTQEIKKHILWFIILTFMWTTGWVLFAEQLGENNLPPIEMFGPMLAAFFVQKVIAKKPIFGKEGLGFIVGKKRYWVIGPALIVILFFVIYALTYLFDPSLFVATADLPASLAAASIPLGDSVVTVLLLLFGLNVLVGPFLNIPIMLGEEVGWRGFLTPNMLRIFGKQGLIWANVVWALWHIPMIFFKGLNYAANPWLGILFMIGFCVPMGIIYQTVYQRSGGSIWIMGLMHGVTNQFAMTVMNFFVREDVSFDTFLYGPTGIIGIVVIGLAGVYFYKNYDIEPYFINRTKNEHEKQK